MPRITKPLTNIEIDKAKPKDKEFNLSDGDGLALRITPNGSKTWFLNYYHPFSKKRQKISLGVYPEISLAQARKKRLEAKSLLAQKIDPKEHRDEALRALELAHLNTLEKVTLDWFELKKTKVTKDYGDDLWRSFENHIFPKLGKFPVGKITAPKTIEVLKPLAAKGSLETVRRMSQRLNEVMVFAVNTGVIFSNPLSGIKHAFEAPKKQNMATLRPEELPNLMKALNTANIKIVTRALIEWQLHTMVRPSEAAGTKWEELDFENKLWIIPAERMKKNREHVVPLSNQAISLIDSIRPISGHREFLFPSDRDPRKHSNSQTANMAIKRMGFQGKLVSHGLRALASTILNEQGFDPDLIEASLAHIDKNEVRRAYNRAEYLERRRPLMQWWSEHIENAATGNMSLSGGLRGIRLVNS